MTTRSRLARLETRVQSSPNLVRHSPEAMRRAEVARQRLQDCTDPEEALRLTHDLPDELLSALLRLFPDALLIDTHRLLESKAHREGLIYGHTPEELRGVPVSELLRLHRDNLRHVEKRSGRYR
jgi:hypothetical protein